MRLALKVPAVILGVPIPESENPYIASPVANIIATVDVRECRLSEVEVPQNNLNDLIRGFWSRILEGMGLSACAKIEFTSDHEAPLSGLYASLTVGLIHALARSYGEVLEAYEIIEIARYGDVDTAEWGRVLDALRYAVLKGKTAVYRNEEEHSTLTDESIELEAKGYIALEKPRIVRDRVGSDVYGALIHAMGVAVLEASLRIKEGASIEGVLEDLYPIHEGILNAVWGVREYRPRCIYSPGLPKRLEVLCKP